jgi:hypothetical protein
LSRKVRVGVIVDGKFRRLLSIGESSKGELTIGIQSAATYQYGQDGPSILQQKYTVHASSDSPTYNTITHTQSLSDGHRLRSYALTDAIKSGRCTFTHLFSRRCPNLSNDRYLLRDAKAFVPVILGTCDVNRMTPTHSVFVGHANAEFNVPDHPDFGVQQIIFTNFRVVIVFGMLGLPSHHTGDLMHSMTFKPEEAPPEMQESLWNLMRGRPAQQCLDELMVTLRLLTGKHLRHIINTAGLDAETCEFLVRWAEAHRIPIPPEDEDGIVVIGSTSPVRIILQSQILNSSNGSRQGHHVNAAIQTQ